MIMGGSEFCELGRFWRFSRPINRIAVENQQISKFNLIYLAQKTVHFISWITSLETIISRILSIARGVATWLDHVGGRLQLIFAASDEFWVSSQISTLGSRSKTENDRFARRLGLHSCFVVCSGQWGEWGRVTQFWDFRQGKNMAD